MRQNSLDEKYYEHQRYLDERKIWLEQMRRSSDLFDKTLLVVSGGALALSVGFIQNIVPGPDYVHLSLLIIGWSLLIVGISLSLISLLTSLHACLINIETLDEQAKNSKNKKKRKNCWRKTTSCLNWAALLCTILGVVFVTLFVYYQMCRRVDNERGGNERASIQYIEPAKDPGETKA